MTTTVDAHASRPERTTAARGITPGLLVVLALLSAIAPFATDLYLPAFPTMTGDLGTSATAVQLTLTAFLVGIAVGQLVFGPLSDRMGRLGPLVAGAVLCVVASAAAAMAPTVAALVVARFVQGLSGAAGMVIGRAIISDLSVGPAAARAFSLMMIVGGVAPVIAPLVGSLLVADLGWRGILWVVCALAVVMLAAVLVVVRESHPRERRVRSTPGSSTSTSRRALLGRTYLGSVLAFAFAFAVMMAYISASPFVYQSMIGLSELQYGLLFGLNAIGLVVVSGLAARLATSVSPQRLLTIGLTLVLAASVAVLLLALSGASPAWLPVPLFVAVSSLGLVLGTATARALAAVPARIAGAASAVLGALQFVLAAAATPLVSLGGEQTAVPLGIVMVASACIAIGAFIVSRATTTSD